MLDSDLAKLCQYYNGTKTINQAAKRHIKRFMFQLNNKEYKIVVPIWDHNNMTRTISNISIKQGFVAIRK